MKKALYYLKMVNCPVCGKRGGLYLHYRKFYVYHNTTTSKRLAKNVHEIHGIYKGFCKLNENQIKDSYQELAQSRLLECANK